MPVAGSRKRALNCSRIAAASSRVAVGVVLATEPCRRAADDAGEVVRGGRVDDRPRRGLPRQPVGQPPILQAVPGLAFQEIDVPLHRVVALAQQPIVAGTQPQLPRQPDAAAAPPRAVVRIVHGARRDIRQIAIGQLRVEHVVLPAFVHGLRVEQPHRRPEHVLDVLRPGFELAGGIVGQERDVVGLSPADAFVQPVDRLVGTGERTGRLAHARDATARQIVNRRWLRKTADRDLGDRRVRLSRREFFDAFALQDERELPRPQPRRMRGKLDRRSRRTGCPKLDEAREFAVERVGPGVLGLAQRHGADAFHDAGRRFPLRDQAPGRPVDERDRVPRP